MKKGNAENLEGKRGRKGGTTFPRYGLKHLLPLLKSLVSKTHTNSINIEQLSAGVFGVGAKGASGKVKSSALKQFGLLGGDNTKFKATELCSKITMAEGEEQKLLLQNAFSKVSIFVNTLNTFQNSKTDKSKIGQYAVSTLKVHPDMKDDFINVLLESAEISGLCAIEGSFVTFKSLNTAATATVADEEVDESTVDGTPEENNGSTPEGKGFPETPPIFQNPGSMQKKNQPSNINVNIESTHQWTQRSSKNF